MSDNPLKALGRAAREASHTLAELSTEERNSLLLRISAELLAAEDAILAANAEDLTAAKAAGISPAMQDRLLLNEARLKDLAADVRQVAALHDPLGEIIDGHECPSGLSLFRKRFPLGVVAAIYEARPNVTVDTAVLCLKTGNAVLLRGGKETRRTNAALIAALHLALAARGLPRACVQAVLDPNRDLVTALLHLDAYVDILIPRGGPELHRLCREQSRIPVITGGIGVCHIFVDAQVDAPRALAVIANAKTQRPSVCNAVETLLVHKDIAETFLPSLAAYLGPLGVTLHSSPAADPFLIGVPCPVTALDPAWLDKEHLTLDLNVHVVGDLDEAIAHIRAHGTGHSDAVLTENMRTAELFVRRVDSSAVYVNASTRFTDGGQFGLGAEVAVSTQKLHARGPMALEALTTYKWIGRGSYTVRT